MHRVATDPENRPANTLMAGLLLMTNVNAIYSRNHNISIAADVPYPPKNRL
jgi:hypothetical protein